MTVKNEMLKIRKENTMPSELPAKIRYRTIIYMIVYGVIVIRRFSETVTPQSGDGPLKSDSSGERGW